MKKLILLALAVGSIASAQAQKAGSMLIYGNIGLSAKSTETDPGVPGAITTKDKTFGINFAPGIGYQVNKNWTFGLQFGVGYDKTYNDYNNDEVKNTSVYIGPFARYTMPINKTFFLWHQVNVGYMGGRKDVVTTGSIFTDKTYTNGVGANFMPAIGINVTRCIALNFSIGGVGFHTTKETYNQNNAAYPTEVRHSGFDLTFGRQFNFGISANLGGKKHMGHREPGMEHRRHMNMDDDDDMEIKVKRKKVKIEEDED